MKPVYSFVDDLPKTTEVKVKRKCLGYSERCRKYVTDMSNRRICAFCSIDADRLQNPGKYIGK